MKKIELKFSIHYSFVLMMLLSIVLGQFILILSYFACLALHEMVHAFFAKRSGYKLGKICLAFGGAVLQAETDEFTFKDEILIAISAPLFNLSFALIVIAFWWIYPESYNYTLDLAVINFAIFAFNILPVFPLDGGRVLLGALSQKIERKTAVRIVKTISILFSVLLIVIFIISLFFSPLYSFAIGGVNLILSVVSEDKKASYKKVFYKERKQRLIEKKGMEGRNLYVSRKFSFLKLMKLIDARHFTIFTFVDEDFKVVARLSETEVEDRIKQGKYNLE